MNNAWIFMILSLLSIEQIVTYFKLNHSTPILSIACLTMSILGWVNTIIN